MDTLTTAAPARVRAEPEEAVPRRSGYVLFWMFVVAGLLGALLETAYMLLVWGELQNRSSLLYGQLSLVWGMGAVLFTLLPQGIHRRGTAAVFLAGAVSATVLEYLCSWGQEMAFGACFWNYSHLPLNLDGRVNPFHSLLWGLAAVVWSRAVMDPLCRRLARRPSRPARWATRALAAVLAADILLTGAALVRMDQRHQGVPAVTAAQQLLDRAWPDERLEAHFSSLTYIGTEADRRAAGVS